MSELGETRFIKIIKEAHGDNLPQAALGIGDDAAFVPLCGGGVVTSTDMLVENEDFSLDWALPEDIGHKSLAVNISDLAAMGSRPAGYLLSLAVPADCPDSFVASFAKGLAEVSKRFDCPIYGGDLSAIKGPITINIVVFGERGEKLLHRGKAQAGEDIYVAGRLGGAAAGLHILMKCPELRERYPELVRCQLRPEPLMAIGMKLCERDLATSAMDVSDGIASDLPRLLPSGLGALLQAADLPLVPGVDECAAQCGKSAVDWALSGGEDYALLFTAKADKAPLIAQLSLEESLPIVKIGTVTADGRFLVHDKEQISPLKSGFDHFSN